MDKFNIELLLLNLFHHLVFPELQINYSCFPFSISVFIVHNYPVVIVDAKSPAVDITLFGKW
jgi:hypothetical protein